MLHAGRGKTFQEMAEFEFWLLDIVILHRIPLCWLLWEDLSLVINKKIKLPDTANLIHLLEKMLDEGDVILFKDNSKDGFKPSSKELSIALFGHDETIIHYGVTKQGGASWEDIAMPNWKKYLCASYGTEPNNGEIIAADRDLIEQQLVNEEYQGHNIITESIVWDKLIPWEAAYWKTLPVGHRAKFDFVYQGSPHNQGIRLSNEWLIWKKKIDQWYKNPFVP